MSEPLYVKEESRTLRSNSGGDCVLQQDDVKTDFSHYTTSSSSENVDECVDTRSFDRISPLDDVPLCSPGLNSSKKSSSVDQKSLQLGNSSQASCATPILTTSNDEEKIFIDEFGFLISGYTGDVQANDIKTMEQQQMINIEKWSEMTRNWKETSSTLHDRLKKRCRKGIPTNFRGIVWQLLLRSREMMDSPESLGVYMALSEKRIPENVHSILERDLSRTLPTHFLFTTAESGGQAALRRALTAYANNDPEVGYCQGMAFLAGMLMTQMGEQEAFWALRELMFNSKYRLREIFIPGFPLLHIRFYQLERLMQILVPRVFFRLNDCQISPSYYATQWFITLFVCDFLFPAALRIWDIFCAEGWKIIFRISIALLQWREESILKADFDELMILMKNLQDQREPNKLLDKALHVKFKTKQLNAWEREYHNNNLGRHVIK